MSRAWYRDDVAYWAILAAAGLLFSLLMCADSFDVYRSGANDFVVFYSGARLVGTPDLYDREANYAVARDVFGRMIPSWRYIRLPFHAVALWPLGRLDYSWAYGIWCVLSIAALIGFVWLWRIPSRGVTLFAVAWSLPAFASLVSGQDSIFVALFIALTVWLERSRQDDLAGAALALCAIKIHLIVLVPCLLLAQRRWRILRGFAATAAVLAGVSFDVAGWTWPREFLRAAFDAQVHPRIGSMPNLHGLFDGWPGAAWFEAVASLGVAALACRSFRRSDFAAGLAVALIGGFLIGRHAYALDTVILLPAILMIAAGTNSKTATGLAVFLLSPIFYLSVSLPHPFSYAGQLALVGLFVVSAWPAHKSAIEAGSGSAGLTANSRAVSSGGFKRNLHAAGQPGKIK